MNLEEVWRVREEEVYPAIFGGAQRGIFTLSQALFSERFGRNDVDPRWLFMGVFEFAPTRTRPFWIYVTSGSSNPWEQDPADYDRAGQSGAGVEFLFASAEQGDWAIRFLLNMLAFDLLLSAGHFQGAEPLKESDRVPLRSPINGEVGCDIRNAIVSRPASLPTGFELPSGRAEFLTFTGVTDEEIGFAKTNGTPALIQALAAAHTYPVTDPRRRPIV